MANGHDHASDDLQETRVQSLIALGIAHLIDHFLKGENEVVVTQQAYTFMEQWTKEDLSNLPEVFSVKPEQGRMVIHLEQKDFSKPQ